MAEAATESEYESHEDSDSNQKNEPATRRSTKKLVKGKTIASYSNDQDEDAKNRYFQDQPDDSDSSPDPISEFDKIKELTEIIRRKNQNIKDLLFDVKVLGDENELLKNKLNETKDKLSEATEEIQELSIVATNAKSENTHNVEKIRELENMNASLKNQIDDLIQANKEQDAQMSEFALQMDLRINQWKEMLEAKELEIENIHRRQSDNNTTVDVDSNIAMETMKQYEDEIEVLKTKLNEATVELTNSSEIIANLSSQKLSLEKSVEQLKNNDPTEASKTTNILQQLKTDFEKSVLEKLEIEDVLKIKEIELAEALAKINKFESGELGLKEVLTSYKKAKHQIRVRDEHINKLISDNNKHVHYRDQLQLENSIMRNKLNLSPEHPINTDDILSNHAKRKKDLDKALQNIANLEEEKISLEIKLRQKEKCMKKLCSYVNEKGLKIPENFILKFLNDEKIETEVIVPEVIKETPKTPEKEIIVEYEKKSPSIDEEKIENREVEEKFDLLKENYDNLVEENEIIREGIHEIAIILKEKTEHLSDGGRFIYLDNLLRTLDDHHNTKWYYPTIKILLESKIQKENQDRLKTLLDEARREILNALSLLEKETRKTDKLEKQLEHFKTIQIERKIESPKKTPECFETTCEQVPPDYTNMETINETVVNQADQKYFSLLNENIRRFHNQFKILNESMVEIFSQYNNEKAQWEQRETNYKDEIESFKILISSQKDTEKSTGQSKKDIVEEKLFAERKLKYLEECVKQARQQYQNVLSDFTLYKVNQLNTINGLELNQQKLHFQIVEMQNSLRKTIPIEIFLKQNSLLNSIQLKYRDILNEEYQSTSNISQSINDNSERINVLKSQNELLQKEKQDLEKYLKEEANKNAILISGGKCDVTFKEINILLKNTQTDLISTKQKVSYLENMNSVFANQFDSLNEKLNDFKKLLAASEERASQLEASNLSLQHQQASLLDKLQYANFSSNENSDMRNELNNLKIENRKLMNQIDVLTEQNGNFQQNKLLNDLEINMLRHQIVDLQSVNDSKAIIARLSSEILITHLHTAELHKKREKLSINLVKEQEKRKHLEEIINEKDAQFNDFVSKSNSKINFLYMALQILRNQYQGSLPLTILENIVNTRKELNMKLKEFEKLKNEFDMKKDELIHSYILKNAEEQNSFNKDICTIDEYIQCAHLIQLKINESKWQREKKSLEINIENFKVIQSQMESKIETLEEGLLMLSFALESNKTSDNPIKNTNHLIRSTSTVEVTDVDDYISQDISEKIPIPKPRKIVKETIDSNTRISSRSNENLPGSSIKISPVLQQSEIKSSRNSIHIQTENVAKNTTTQTERLTEVRIDNEEDISTLKNQLIEFKEKTEKISQELKKQRNTFDQEKAHFENLVSQKDNTIKALRLEIENKCMETKHFLEINETDEIEHLKKLLEELKKIELEKNEMISKLKVKLEQEKEEHKKSNVLAQKQIIEMRLNMNSLENELQKLKNLLNEFNLMKTNVVTTESNRGRTMELEARCFQLQKDFDNERSNLLSLKSECERWKSLAAERFSNMEMLSKRLEEKHSHEVVSYKTETNHWLSELADAKHLISSLKVEMNDQSTMAIKELAEKDSLIHKLEKENDALKHKVMSLQTSMVSADGNFDISDLIEIEDYQNTNDEIMSKGKDFNFDDLSSEQNDTQSRKAYKRSWFETVIERIRREKYLLGKQNALLRKQIQILSARERRSKLELQNVKAQMCRMTYVDNPKFSSNESFVEHLQKKIEILEQQIAEKNVTRSPGRTKQLALWDKQKRWQETADRWKMKYEEKCQQCEKLEKLYEAAKATLQRLEKEKRCLDSRLSKYSKASEGPTPSTAMGDYDNHLEMLLQDKERLEEEIRTLKQQNSDCPNKNSLVEKIESQQRRITALEVAEKGKSLLVNEYEKLLEQNSLLSKQNLKLESEILELQLQSVGKKFESEGPEGEPTCCKRMKQQNEHLENYVKLLKEENSKLIAKNIASEALDQQPTKTGTLSQNKRIADLERTILTLRGLISGLQAENKKLSAYGSKSSKSSINEKSTEELRIEISNLKATIKDKDNLLEKAKNLLRRAAEKEKELISDVNKQLT